MVRMLKQNKLARLIFGHYLMVRSKCCILAKKYNKNQKCVFVKNNSILKNALD